VRAEDFRHRAACREVVDADVFFPAVERGPDRDAQVRAAKAVCAGCPVLARCQEWALSSQVDGSRAG
jgi:Transcription factor WhiB.